MHSTYEAAKILREARDSVIEFEIKRHHQDIVSSFDQKIEAFLSRQILSRFPEDGIVGEELEHPHTGQWIWYIDPIA
jgi:fructose-1,6-bisphosphatase/inositol monophosphatase family enzyme